MKTKILAILNIILVILIVTYSAFTIYNLKTQVKELKENQVSVDNCELFFADDETRWLINDEDVEEFCKAGGYEYKISTK